MLLIILHSLFQCNYSHLIISSYKVRKEHFLIFVFHIGDAGIIVYYKKTICWLTGSVLLCILKINIIQISYGTSDKNQTTCISSFKKTDWYWRKIVFLYIKFHVNYSRESLRPVYLPCEGVVRNVVWMSVSVSSRCQFSVLRTDSLGLEGIYEIQNISCH